MSRPDKHGYTQTYDKDWEQISEVNYVQCCNPECKLVHQIRLRVRGGVLEWQWNMDMKETRKVRGKKR